MSNTYYYGVLIKVINTKYKMDTIKFTRKNKNTKRTSERYKKVMLLSIQQKIKDTHSHNFNLIHHTYRHTYKEKNVPNIHINKLESNAV